MTRVFVQLPGEEGDEMAAELEMTSGDLDPSLTIHDRAFRLHPAGERPIALMARGEYRVFEVPRSACVQIGAQEGDYVLTRRAHEQDTQAPFCVVDHATGPAFGSFRRDERGKMAFASLNKSKVIGDADVETFAIYYPVAWLRPTDAGEE